MSVELVRERLEMSSATALCRVDVWEKLLAEFGFNDENPNELPELMLNSPGLGLRIWQYPCQFAPYMGWLASKASMVRSYLEIGTRHGGTFVVQAEMLRRMNPRFVRAVAVDLIDQPSLLTEFEYRQEDTRSDSFKAWVGDQFFDVVFVDGDHSYEGVKDDAEATVGHCNIQVFHDISSDSCPAVRQYWLEHRDKYSQTHDFLEFVEQYESVNGSFFGIGVARRKDWIE